MRFFFPQALFLAAGMGFLACGCSTTPSTTDLLPTKRPTLYRTQAGDQVTLQWESEVGARYAVIYTPDREDPNLWRVLPAFSDLAGSGGAQVITFKAPQSGRLYYRISPVGSDSR